MRWIKLVLNKLSVYFAQHRLSDPLLTFDSQRQAFADGRDQTLAPANNAGIIQIGSYRNRGAPTPLPEGVAPPYRNALYPSGSLPPPDGNLHPDFISHYADMNIRMALIECVVDKTVTMDIQDAESMQTETAAGLFTFLMNYNSASDNTVSHEKRQRFNKLSIPPNGSSKDTLEFTRKMITLASNMNATEGREVYTQDDLRQKLMDALGGIHTPRGKQFDEKWNMATVLAAARNTGSTGQNPEESISYPVRYPLFPYLLQLYARAVRDEERPQQGAPVTANSASTSNASGLCMEPRCAASRKKYPSRPTHTQAEHGTGNAKNGQKRQPATTGTTAPPATRMCPGNGCTKEINSRNPKITSTFCQ